jgi:hypothetical protein
MKKTLSLSLLLLLAACGGGGGSGSAAVANDTAIVGSWGYRSDGKAYDALGCGGPGLSGVVLRVRHTFDGSSFTQLVEACTATASGNQFQATDQSMGIYTTGDVVRTITYIENGAVQKTYPVKAIDVYNSTLSRQTYSSYVINETGQLFEAVTNGANDGSTAALRRVDVENGYPMTKLN